MRFVTQGAYRMDAEFWHTKWQSGDIGFHQPNGNPALVDHFSALSLVAGSRVFVPLCGKTGDIAWLLAQGQHVVGAELSQVAIDQLFSDLGHNPVIKPVGPLIQYSGPQIDIYVGDIFDVTAQHVGPVDGVYDRAALVALPDDLRRRYAGHLKNITRRAPQLVVCFNYDQAKMTGPPFSIDADMLHDLYQDDYILTQLSTRTAQFKSTTAQELTWHLHPDGRE